MYYKNEMGYDYPDRCDAHMIEVKHVRDVKIDVEYPYLDKRRRFRFMRGLYWLLVTLIVFPLCRLTHGLRIYGKEHLKKNKAEHRKSQSFFAEFLNQSVVYECIVYSAKQKIKCFERNYEKRIENKYFS